MATQPGSPALRDRLLRDVYKVFYDAQEREGLTLPWIPIDEIIPELLKMPEWRLFNQSRGLNAYDLVKLLRQRGLRPTKSYWTGRPRSGYDTRDVIATVKLRDDRGRP